MFDFEPSTGASLEAFRQMFLLQASGNETSKTDDD
jgi:hypothetical protein